MLPLLLLGTEVEEDRQAGGEGRHLDTDRVLVPSELLVEHLLVRRGEALASVLLGNADAREPRVEQHPLELPVVGDGGEFDVVLVTADHGTRDLARLERTEVVADPRPCTPLELLEVCGRYVAHAAPISRTTVSPTRRRCSLGVP